MVKVDPGPLIGPFPTFGVKTAMGHISVNKVTKMYIVFN